MRYCDRPPLSVPSLLLPVQIKESFILGRHTVDSTEQPRHRSPGPKEGEGMLPPQQQQQHCARRSSGCLSGISGVPSFCFPCRTMARVRVGISASLDVSGRIVFDGASLSVASSQVRVSVSSFA